MKLLKRVRVVEAEVYQGCRDAEAFKAAQERERVGREWQRRLTPIYIDDCEYLEATLVRIMELQDKGKALASEGKSLSQEEVAEGFRLASELTERVHAAQPDRETLPKICMNFHPRGLPYEEWRPGMGGGRRG